MTRPAWIAASVIDELQGIVARLETIASSYPVDPTKAASFSLQVATGPAVSSTTPAPLSRVTGLYPALVALYNALPMLVDPETGVDPSVSQGIIALSEGLCAAMQPADAVAAFAAEADALEDPLDAPTGATINRQTDTANAALIARFARMAFLAAYVEGLVTAPWRIRSDAITARADCAQRFERELSLCGLGPDIAVTQSLVAMRDRAISYLSQAIVDTKPVITVSAATEIPALLLAWRLYGGNIEANALDLIARNGVAVAEFVQPTFEAMAP